jgi:hypothetical protein
MPAVQNPDQTFSSVLQEVRDYLRDFPELNRLLKSEETSDRQLAWHVIEALDDFNNSPPPIGRLDISSIPRSILIKGVMAEALTSAAVLNLRNSLRYTDGQISVDLDKHQAMLAMAQMFRQQFDTKMGEWKRSQNLMRALSGASGVFSEYSYFSAGYYGQYLFRRRT